MPVTIAVVAPGAMGSAVGRRLASRGARVLTALDGRSAATRARAEAAGMVDASMEVLAKADMVLSIVPPDQALPLAVSVAAAISRAGSAPAYVDLNAINPATAREIGHALAGSGARYWDGSIVGLPPKPDETGPTLYLAGASASASASAADGDEAAEMLRAHGLAVRTLAGGIGAASALKMTYAGLTKGMTALATAMILAAQREGAAPALAAELASSQPELLARLRRSVPDMLPKAYRWVPEMKEIAAFLGDTDPAHGIYAAMAELYQQVADDDGTLAAELNGFVAR